jgi:putative membrane protein
MPPFLTRWICTTLAVAVAVKITGMDTGASWGSFIGTALLLGILNALVRPVLLLLSLPFIVVTLGFFILVVNALMFWLAGELMGLRGIHFGNALIASVIVSIVSWTLSLFFKGRNGQYHLITHHESIKRVEGRVIE